MDDMKDFVVAIAANRQADELFDQHGRVLEMLGGSDDGKTRIEGLLDVPVFNKQACLPDTHPSEIFYRPQIGHQHGYHFRSPGRCLVFAPAMFYLAASEILGPGGLILSKPIAHGLLLS
ncbi:MAG: hypothetical protein IID32_08880 [Planctomycetes bacterium]|nr:hypothetical protein [Planctomycetota bacterium]